LEEQYQYNHWHLPYQDLEEFQWWLDRGSFYVDQLVNLDLTAALFTTATKTLTSVGAFSSYTHSTNDVINITGGTGVTTGLYTIDSKTDNNSIVLVDDIGGTNPADVTSSSSALGNDVNLRHFVRMSQEGSKVPTTNWGRIVAKDRAGDIKTEYETESPTKFDHVNLCAVNGDA